jgi:N-acetylneuraminate synthase
MKSFKIGNIKIGEKHNPIVVVEIGINHKGSLDLAIYMVDKAIKSGAQIIKHQTHVIDDEMSFEAKKIRPGNANMSIYDVIKKNSLNEKDEKRLMNYVKSRNKIFISTPFSRRAADRLQSFDVPAFKIGSGECNNYPLVEYIAKFRKPIILSTGMNSIETIKPSVKIFRKYKIPYALLHCTNIYPTPSKLVRINSLTLLNKKFPDAVLGISDHTNNIYTSIAAVALGASVIEKHFTIDKNLPGPDHKASLEPAELRSMITGIRNIEEARGNGIKRVMPSEISNQLIARKSIVAKVNIKKGEIFSYENLTF